MLSCILKAVDEHAALLRESAADAVSYTHLNPDTRVRDVTDEEVGKIRDAIEELQIPVEGDLRREIALNIKRLQEIGCYRGCLLYTSRCV